MSFIIDITTPQPYEECITGLFLAHGAEGTATEGAALIAGAIKAGKAEIWDENQLHPVDDLLVVSGYYEGPEAFELHRKEILKALADLTDLFQQEFPVSYRNVNQEDWQDKWKEFYTILHLGEGFVVRPEWMEYSPKEGELVITIDPGMAFGTGNHPTTGNALRLVERYLKKGDRVLDCGCGTGILACGAGLLGASFVLGVDIDHDAILATVKNFRINGLLDISDVNCKNLLEEPLYQRVPFDLIIANIVPDVIIPLLPKILSHLTQEGTVILGGIIPEREKEVMAALAENGLQLKDRIEEKAWVTLAAERA